MINEYSPETCDLSIIIVNWNTRELLAECLESVVRGQESGAGGLESEGLIPDPRSLIPEVLVVDNASTDGSAAMVRERFPWVRLIENRENVGFARANNRAIRESTGRYVLLLNPDTVVRPDALSALVCFMAAHPEAGAAGARLINPDGSLQVSAQPFPTLGRELWRLLHMDAFHPFSAYPRTRWRSSESVAVDVVQGACLMVRRTALAQIGLLDPDYFMYSEEVDLCKRIRKAGWRIFWVPQATVIHWGGQSSRQVPEAMFLQLYRAKTLYFRKQHGRWQAGLYKAILWVVASLRLALAPVAARLRPTNRGHYRILAAYYWRLRTELPGF